MDLYSQTYDFEKNFQSIIEMLQAKRPPQGKEERTLVQALEYQKHALMAFFEPNSVAPGVLMGVGKEPDHPNDTMKEYIRNYGKAHRKNGLKADHLFIFGEEVLSGDGGKWLFITGARASRLLNVRPHIESYKFEVTRYKKGTIEAIGEQIKAPTLNHHKMFIDGYFDIDKVGVTALDKLMHFRGNK